MVKGVDLKQAKDRGNKVQEKEFGRTANMVIKEMNNKKIALTIIGLLVVIGSLVWYFTSKKAGETAKDKKEKVAPVTVAVARLETIPIEIRTIGNVQSYSVVNVVPQVGGQLTKVYFTQGQNVKKGDLLFEIDPRPYQAALAQAEGNVARDKAQVKEAQANLAKDQAQVGQLQANLRKDIAQAAYARTQMTRYTDLVNQGAVSHEQSDQMSTNSLSADAVIAADKKSIENAKAVLDADKAQIDTTRGVLQADQAVADNARIQLGWTTIRSSIDGRTGSLNVYEGNVVAANNQTPLVTISQVQPIYISFTVPEGYLDAVRRSLSNGTLTVQALIEGIKTNAVSGAVSFLESTINTTSGTVVLRATFANIDNHLFPGQFVDVVATMPPEGSSVVVPASAVQPSQQGNSVYIVDPGNKVRLVTVDLKRTHGDLAAIGKGVAVGDTVVTDGQLQLMPGATVRIIQDNSGGSK